MLCFILSSARPQFDCPVSYPSTYLYKRIFVLKQKWKGCIWWCYWSSCLSYKSLLPGFSTSGFSSCYLTQRLKLLAMRSFKWIYHFRFPVLSFSQLICFPSKAQATCKQDTFIKSKHNRCIFGIPIISKGAIVKVVHTYEHSEHWISPWVQLSIVNLSCNRKLQIEWGLSYCKSVIGSWNCIQKKIMVLISYKCCSNSISWKVL
jgi:hypothetical protein